MLSSPGTTRRRGGEAPVLGGAMLRIMTWFVWCGHELTSYQRQPGEAGWGGEGSSITLQPDTISISLQFRKQLRIFVSISDMF